MKSNNITRLNYQMIFNEDDPHEGKKESERKLSEARELLEEKDSYWQEKLQKARDEAYEQGKKEGIDSGYKKAAAEIDEKVSTLEKAFQEAHTQWKKNQEEIGEGLINVAFDMAEAIIGAKPSQNGPVQKQLQNEIEKLLRSVDVETKSALYVNKEDKSVADTLLKKYDDELTVKVHVSEKCKPGEFILENNEMKVVRNLKMLLSDFKESLSIPHWS